MRLSLGVACSVGWKDMIDEAKDEEREGDMKEASQAMKVMVVEEETRLCLRHFVRLVGPTRKSCRLPMVLSVDQAQCGQWDAHTRLVLRIGRVVLT
jgi:hypothetical protein